MRGLLVIVGVLVATVARAEPKPYRGPHPIDLEGRWHDETSVHVHDDLPVGRAPFAEIDGVLVFLASARAYGYRGEVWTYRGAHPLPPAIGGDCGITDEHDHPFAPEGAFRQERSGTYVFTGALRGGVRAYVPGRVIPERAIAVDSSVQSGVVGGYAPCRVYQRVDGVVVSVPVFAGYPCGGADVGTQHPNAGPPTPPGPYGPRVAPTPPVAPSAPVPRHQVRRRRQS